jgi:hypothetical protein
VDKRRCLGSGDDEKRLLLLVANERSTLMGLELDEACAGLEKALQVDEELGKRSNGRVGVGGVAG